MAGMKDSLGDVPYGDLFGHTRPTATPKPTAAAEAARDEGAARVLDNAGDDWFRLAMGAVMALPRGWIGTLEDFRLSAVEVIGHPHHPNAWGAVALAAVKRGLLVATGEMRKPRAVASHARKTQVMRRT